MARVELADEARRLRGAQEEKRRRIFLRYLGEVATAVAQINGVDRAALYEQLLAVAKKKTAEADVKLDDRGKPIQDEEDLELGDNCIIVPQTPPGLSDDDAAAPERKPSSRGRRAKGRTARTAAVGAARPTPAAARTVTAKRAAAKKRGRPRRT